MTRRPAHNLFRPARHHSGARFLEARGFSPAPRPRTGRPTSAPLPAGRAKTLSNSTQDCSETTSVTADMNAQESV